MPKRESELTMPAADTVTRSNTFFLLLSSDAGTWKNACSEVYRLLKEKLAIESNYRPLKSPVKGLSLLEVDDHVHLPEVIKLLGEEDTAAWLTYCKKITPIEEIVKASEELIVQRAKYRFLANILAGESWKIEIKKRHSNISRTGIIEKIAREIGTNYPVKLEKPDKVLRLEIIGEEVGIVVIKPDQLISGKNKPVGGYGTGNTI
ncbi:MAG: THUMP domain-containing protein [Candidatus Odinarchaeota archaeon]